MAIPDVTNDDIAVILGLAKERYHIGETNPKYTNITKDSIDTINRVAKWVVALKGLSPIEEVSLALEVLKKHQHIGWVHSGTPFFHPGIQGILELNEMHLTEECRNQMEEDDLIGVDYFDNHGYWMELPCSPNHKELYEKYHPCMIPIVTFAEALKCRWIHFGAYNLTEGLPVYE